MNVSILDIGNSKTKAYVFDIDMNRKYYQVVDCVWADQVATPRYNPMDLLDTCREFLTECSQVYKCEAGIVTSFGDGFILKSKNQYVFADEPAPSKPEYAYHVDGWPRNIQLSSIRALKAKHESDWGDMHSINGWVTSHLCGEPNDNPWHAWDITQASVSGLLNLQTQKWIDDAPTGREMYQDSRYTHLYNKKAPSIIPSSKIVGQFDGMPLLAGGMDNAFIDTTNPDPYVIAGTWLVIGALAKTDEDGEVLKDEWTNEAREAGVRWLISGNGNYHKQIVRKVSDPITDEETDRILEDLKVVGVEPSHTETHFRVSKGWFQPARVRVFGGYGGQLAETLTEKTRRYHFYAPSQTPMRPDLYQHEQTAQYVYNEVIK